MEKRLYPRWEGREEEWGRGMWMEGVEQKEHNWISVSRYLKEDMEKDVLGYACVARIIIEGHSISMAYWCETKTSSVKCNIVRLRLHRIDSMILPATNSASPVSSWSTVSPGWAFNRPRCSARSRRVCREGSGPDRSGCLSLNFASFLSFALLPIVADC